MGAFGSAFCVVLFRLVLIYERSIRQDAGNFVLWRNVPIIQRQKPVLHDRERGGTENIHGQGHREKPFLSLKGEVIYERAMQRDSLSWHETSRLH
jgi:hypothetical protein